MATVKQVQDELVNRGEMDEQTAKDFVAGNKDEVTRLVNKGLSPQAIVTELAKHLEPKENDTNKDRTERGGENG